MANPYEYRGRGEGFLDDYSNLSGVASAVQGFADAFDKAQDRSYKRIEQQAQMDALKTKAQREQFQSKLDAAKEGLAIGADGELTPGALTPKAQAANQLAGQKIQAQAGATQARLDQGAQRLDLQRQRFGETQSQNASKAGNDIEKDPVMKDLTNSRQSLQRGLSLLDGKTPLTYNNLNAVQQDIINAMTRGGQSSEGKVNREMQESWIGRWNNLKAKAGQYGDANDIRTMDPGLYKQIQGLLNEVDSSVAKNQSERVKSLSSSYGQTSNQKVKSVVGAKLQQYAAPEESKGLVPQGLVKPGKVGAAPTADGMSQALAQTHPEKNQALDWAKSNVNNPDKNIAAKAQAILQRLGQ